MKKIKRKLLSNLYWMISLLLIVMVPVEMRYYEGVLVLSIAAISLKALLVLYKIRPAMFEEKSVTRVAR